VVRVEGVVGLPSRPYWSVCAAAQQGQRQRCGPLMEMVGLTLTYSLLPTPATASLLAATARCTECDRGTIQQHVFPRARRFPTQFPLCLRPLPAAPNRMPWLWFCGSRAAGSSSRSSACLTRSRSTSDSQTLPATSVDGCWILGFLPAITAPTRAHTHTHHPTDITSTSSFSFLSSPPT
jgi:hypothetical protein